MSAVRGLRRTWSVVVALALACAPATRAAPGARAIDARPVLHIVSIAIEDYAPPLERQPGALQSAVALRDSLRAVAGAVYAVRTHALSGRGPRRLPSTLS